MRVKLISMTRPVFEVNGKVPTPEELMVYCARVSSPQNQESLDTAPKLLKYCIKNAHWSIFEHVSFTVEIKTSRAIAAQILRHKTAYFQEFSLRYSEATENEFCEARRQDDKNRQNSIDDMSYEEKNWFLQAQKEVVDRSHDLYRQALERGVAKELARMLLPLSTRTTLYMTNNVRNWIHYLQLRSGNGTQKEHADIANAIIKDIFIPNFPVISEVMGWR